MRAHPLGSLAVGVLVLSTTLASQVSQPQPGAAQPGPPAPRAQVPPRDGAAAQAPTGTGRIRGRVMAADGSTPLRRAHVRVTSTELRVNRAAVTDADGRYDIAELPQGRYSISVSRNGYVSLQFGQQRPFEPGRPLDLGDGQLMDRIDFALPRGAVITGRVTDEVGEPMAGVRMQAMRYQYQPNGQRRLVPVMTPNPFNLVSNDLGEFRVYGLMPGSYVLSATPEEAGSMMVGASPATVNVAGPAGGPAEPDGHGITYYPGTINPDEAQPIAVGVAEEANASLALVPSRMTRITGVVRNSQGRPVSGVMMGLRTQVGSGMFSSRGLPGIGPDGTFSIMNVPPGDHWLEIYPRTGDDESAVVAITAGGRDINDLVITTSPGTTASGRVVFDGTAVANRPGRIILMPPETGMPLPGRNTRDNGVIDPTGRFQIRGASGRALFRAAQLGPLLNTGWVLRSVTLNDVDVTDTPIDFASLDDVSGIEIVLTDKQTTLSGIVRGSRSGPVKDYVVAIFPDNLKEGVLPARFTRIIRPDQEGRYQTRGLPAGDYFAIAVQSLEQGGEWDPAFRKQVEPTAKRFRLTEGQTFTLDLQLLR